VAPSSMQTSKSATVKLQNNFIAVQKKDGLAKSQSVADKTQTKKAVKTEDKIVEKLDKKDATGQTTSGMESELAVEKNSAITKPSFNAAYLQNPAPIYPDAARRSGLQGKVMLEVQVSKEGNAKMVSIANSSGYAILDHAAREAVKKWHFVPARIGTNSVEAAVLVPIEFKLT
jgi:TonB family protein